jgi:hypothetical protein
LSSRKGEPSEVGGSLRVGVHLGVEGPGEPVRGEQVHAAVAHERGSFGDGVEGPLQAAVRGPLLRAAAPGAQKGDAAVRGSGEVEQMGPFGVVELQRASDRVEHAG